MGPIGPMWPQRRCFCCCPPRASVSSASSAVRSLRRLAPGRQHRGQRRVGVRAARVDVRDDGLRGKGSGRLARLAALLGHELRHRRRPDRLDRRRPDARHGLGPDRAVGHPAEGIQVEPDHFRIARVQAPQDGAPRLPFQPLEDGLAVRMAGEPRAVRALLWLQRARHGHPPFRLPPSLWSLYNIVAKNGGVLFKYGLFRRKSLRGKDL